MPKMTERERLAELEARQHKIADEVETARHELRCRYATIVTELPVERMSEREFREVLTQFLRAGAGPAMAALRALPAIAP